jgi:hypothetical protein
MAGTQTINVIKDIIESNPAIMANLPGGVWTRTIMRNVSTEPGEQTPGSTPGAFDNGGKGRVKRSVSIIGTPESDVPNRAEGAYISGVELWFWCLPHESDKLIVSETIEAVKRLINEEGKSISILGGGARLRYAGALPFIDDAGIGGVLSRRVTFQISGVWR